jgi:hypothetical protein
VQSAREGLFTGARDEFAGSRTELASGSGRLAVGYEEPPGAAS